MRPRDAQILERASRPSVHGPADGRIDADEMQRRLGLASRYLAKRVLVALGADGSVGLETDALVEQLRRLATGAPDTKLRFAFALHDENGDGTIDRAELERLVHIALAENRLELAPDTADALVDAMMAKADLDRDGRISWDEWRASLESFPGVLETITLGDLSRLGLGPAPEPEPPSPDARVWAARSLRSDGLSWLLFAVYLASNVVLFADAWSRYEARGAPVLVQLARGCGACLNFHGAIVLLPMLRRTLTLIGRTALGRILIDDHVGFHRVVGSGALYLAIGHTVAHLLNYATGGAGIAAGLGTWAGATGTILLVVHLALWGFARSPVRRGHGTFELFAITHRLYPLWLGVLLLHGPVAWAWMLVPLTIFAVDRVFGRRVHRTRILGLDALPAGTTRVRIARPSSFHHVAGDYVFACIPALSRFEWHPFTISSAPRDLDPELTLHVRAVGDWTRELRELAELGPAELAIELDGPYGTPTSRALEARHLVMVAGGIGVTPFASVLAALAAGARSACESVHFVWVCREQHAFSWFTDRLGEAELALGDRLTISIFVGSARRDAQSTVLSVAMDALYAHTRRDVVTGLRARTTLGAPDWDELFRTTAARHAPDPVSCFFCGPEGLATIVKRAAARHGIVFRQEHF